MSDIKEFIQTLIDSGIFKSYINGIALLVISILSYFAWRGIYKENSSSSQYAKHAPSILATVGIFFSFLGIAWALINFDTYNIDKSIPILLDGLKSKFIASLMGMFASIVVKIMQVLKIKDKSIMPLDREKEMIDLLSISKSNSQQLLPELAKQSVLLESIKNSLVGDGDSSVITQLKLVKSEISDLDKNSTQNFTNSIKYNHNYLSTLNKTMQDGFKNQIDKFDEFSKILAENNSKAFIEALEKAMRDFNNNITEQFGENFKELNRAVGELLKWQDNYKAHVEKLQQNFQITLDSVKIIESSFSGIQSRSEKFTNTSEKLHGILESLDWQLKDLHNHLKAFDALADNAKDAFPRIEDNLTKLTLSFKNSTEQSLAAIGDTVENMRGNLSDATSKLKDTTGKMRDAMDEQKDVLDSTSQEFKTVAKNLVKETKVSIDNYRDSLQEIVTIQSELLNSTIKKAGIEFDNSIKNTAKQFSEMAESVKLSIDVQEKTLVGVSQNFKITIDKTLRDLSEQSKTTIQNYERELQRAVQEQMNHISNAVKASSDQFNKLLTDNTTKSTSILEQQTDRLDRALQEELRKSIETMGQHLAALSNKFVSDYSPLTDKLREVVRFAEDLRRGRN